MAHRVHKEEYVFKEGKLWNIESDTNCGYEPDN